MRRLFIGVIAGIFPFCSAFAAIPSGIETNQPMASTFQSDALLEAVTAAPSQTMNLIVAADRTGRSTRPTTPPPVIGGATASPS